MQVLMGTEDKSGQKAALSSLLFSTKICVCTLTHVNIYTVRAFVPEGIKSCGRESTCIGFDE